MKFSKKLHAKRAILTIALCFLSSQILAVDLSGTYDNGTLTPLQRPAQFGDNLYLTVEQAKQMEQRIAGMMAQDASAIDPNRPPPKKGKVDKGYNFFWVDPGSKANLVDGKFRTSIITHPKNGQIPKMTPAGAARLKGMLDAWQSVWRNPAPTVGRNTGTAWWLEDGNPDGPYNHIEQRPYAERCIFGSRSTAGPPMLPNVYNNHKRIIQTKDHVMILIEMNHDARIIRLNDQHKDPSLTSYFGDSVGKIVGDELHVTTKNFNNTPTLSGADENLVVHEVFKKLPNGDLFYQFKIEDPTVWGEPWRGEYTWRAAPEDKVYEYACHEGNYALGNVLRGARLLETEFEQEASSAQ